MDMGWGYWGYNILWEYGALVGVWVKRGMGYEWETTWHGMLVGVGQQAMPLHVKICHDRN